MLQIIAVYLLKVLICSALLLAYYWAALRNKRFHYYNRFYLLLAVILSFAIPLLDLQWFSFSSSNKQAITILSVMYGTGEGAVMPAGKGFQLNWQDMLFVIPFMITVFFLLLLAYRIIKIYQIKKRFPVSKTDEFDFINTDIAEAPFSFLKNIFWRNDISLEEKTGQQILRHELAHIKQKHTWDKLFMQIVLAIFWMNPFYWLIQKELYLIHEFIADEKAVEDKDASAFAAMLLHAQYGKFMFAPAQSFFYSPIKRRLLMLTSSKKTSLNYVRRLMALPLLTFVVCLFAFRLHENTKAVTSVNAPFKLVVDAGHGGKDNGAVGVNGILEKDINLAFSKKLKQLSGEYKIDVVLTRDDDKYMSPQEKVEFAKTQNANAFISVHVNATDPAKEAIVTGSGMEVYISKENEHFDESKLLGSAVLQSLKNNFEAATYLSESKTGIWVLKANTLPAILVELGYIDDKNNAANLTNDKKIEQMARKILEGIALYANHPADEIKIQGIKNETAAVADDTTAPKITGKSIAGSLPNGPLYIVDGKIISKSEADKINPNDMQSVNVIKGADAIKEYGDKGSNGVIEITSKNKKEEEGSATIFAPPVIVKDDDKTKNTGIEIRNVKEEVNTASIIDSVVYVIDGKISTREKVNNIKPDNIESMNVLKGKNATDKYGDKAKNGAVEIILKK